jgi:PAS domain S-box-containing protein
VKTIRDHAIFTTDPGGRITTWNDEARRILGYTEAEAIGLHFSAIFTPDDVRAGIPELEFRTAREQGQAEDERWHVRKGGERFWASGIVSPLYGPDGTLAGYSKILRDMTERKRAEEALKAADRQKNEFLAVLAHELRNPLAPVRTALHILKAPGVSEEAVRRAQSMMERQVGLLVRLVDDLLDVARIMRGQIDLRRGPVALASAVESAVETARPVIDAQDHELTVSLPPETVWLNADPARLTQIVSNLLVNSAKYTEKGGQIWLTVRREGEEVVLTVRDTGIGIPPEVLPRVFDLFVQSERARSRAPGGLGVGLSLVKRLVEMHGGSVRADSAGPNRGSVFTVRLPAREGPPPALDFGAAAGEPKEALRVLVVDDNEDAADSLGMLLRLLGHDVHVVSTARDALEAARSGFDIALLDIGLPEMSGYELASRIRGEAGGEKTILVAVTGYGQEADRDRSKEAGFALHLVKPVDPGQLGGVLAELARRRSAEDQGLG